ncbi:hypothetical protein P5673_009904 [Acropora cervicornis]|uniref:Uncharacterized protein n=1 Tax=Acropora cervicornis TaxID=6130 RepID=A0AAD9QS13_ACRCE|nr:hypothetical protein P5673_009904 [Acropora cervicornis]
MALTGTATLAMVKEITQILGMHEFVTVKATNNRPNIMHTVEKMETVPDEEVKKKGRLMDHIFEFGSVWIRLFRGSYKAKLLWKDLTGQRPRSYSETRWWSKWQVYQQTLMQFGDIERFLLEAEATNAVAAATAEENPAENVAAHEQQAKRQSERGKGRCNAISQGLQTLSSAASVWVFSLLENAFGDSQASVMEDYIEASIILQGRHFSPSLPGDRYLKLGSKSDLRAEISGSIVRYDALAPRPEWVKPCTSETEPGVVEETIRTKEQPGNENDLEPSTQPSPPNQVSVNVSESP